jgi:seryl-tRNA synthetase
LPADDVPIGKNAEENVVVREVGDKREFTFSPKDHVELGEALDMIDFEAGAKVAGSGFYYLKNEGALLEIALVHYGLDFLIKRGFTPIATPDLAQKRFYEGTGYLPKGPEAQTYVVNDNDLGLIATAEVTLAGYHADETLDKNNLPKKYAGYSHCFRIEAGSYGKYSKGIYRGHQFTKVEMFAVATHEESIEFQDELLKLEEEFWQTIEIPYRVVKMCTGDLGAQAARKIDLEAWMPGDGPSRSSP